MGYAIRNLSNNRNKMGAAIKKCTQEMVTKLREMGYVDGTWPQYKDRPMEEMSLVTYVGNAHSESWDFVYFMVPSDECFHKDPRRNWIENRTVFTDEEAFLAYAAADKFHMCIQYLYKHCWFVDKDGLYKQCETAKPTEEEFPKDWWRVATPEDITESFESWQKIHRKNTSSQNPT